MKRFLALLLSTCLTASAAQAWPVTKATYGGGNGHVRPPTLTMRISPAGQMITRVGAGAISTTATYIPGGGTPPYSYTTSVTPSLTVTNPGMAVPTFSTTLTAGQNTTYTVTGTVHDSAGRRAPATATINFVATAAPPPGLALVIVPTTQTLSRSGAGAISADFTYVPSGGTPPYTLSTTATGLTITGGTTTTPNLSTTLTSGQNTTYPFSGTLNDSIASPPATANGSVQFISNAVFEPLDYLARGMVGDNISSGNNQAPSRNTSPYTLQPRVVYSSQDIANLVAMGITYVRIPVDVQQVLPRLPFSTFYLLETFSGSGIWQPIPTTQTRTVANPTGCGAIYVSTACSNDFMLTYLDQTIAAMTAQGLAVDLALFAPLTGLMPAGCTATCPTSSVGGGLNLHDIMGPSLALYGYASYEDVFLQANVALVNRYRTTYPNPGQIFFELYNEPDYIGSGTHDTWQNVSIWNAAIISITAAIRAIPDNTHWLISDCPQSGKGEHCQYLVPTSDEKTVYSFHKYDPFALVIQGSGGTKDPYIIYPRPSSGQPAIGRPGGIAPAYMQYPIPAFGSPAGYTTTAAVGCSDSVPLPTTPVTTAWGATPTTVVTAHSMKVCRTGATTSLVDYFPGLLSTGNFEITKSDLLTNAATGIQIPLDWAAAGGHTGPRAAEALRIIAGEIGVTKSGDYLSDLQLVEDLISTLNNNGVVGGQANVPWDWWAFSGAQFGFRPKSQPALTHWCLYASTDGVLAGYDKDWYARIKYPQASMAPHCSGGAYASPGY